MSVGARTRSPLSARPNPGKGAFAMTDNGPRAREVEITKPGDTHHIYLNADTGEERIGEPISRAEHLGSIHPARGRTETR